MADGRLPAPPRLPALDMHVLAERYADLLERSDARHDRLEGKVDVLIEKVDGMPAAFSKRAEKIAADAIKEERLKQLESDRAKRWDVLKVVIPAVILAALGVLGTALLYGGRARGAVPMAPTTYASH